ncbi:MAG TPA: hypothetical protein VM095_19890 [Pyrinomonadaceae bacterium]|nr:hypothetical protein [Pyrinomonadaceae bacterium]
MGTKPMVFPLDVNGHVYVVHNEMDEPVCTGSRETCYRLLAIMLEVKRRVEENELKMMEEAEKQLAEAATDSTENAGLAAKAAGASSPVL